MVATLASAYAFHGFQSKSFFAQIKQLNLNLLLVSTVFVLRSKLETKNQYD